MIDTGAHLTRSNNRPPITEQFEKLPQRACRKKSNAPREPDNVVRVSRKCQQLTKQGRTCVKKHVKKLGVGTNTQESINR